MQFFIEQIAIAPRDPERARALLSALGLKEWVEDTVVANGRVFGSPATNTAALAFNYQATSPENKPLELEILNYKDGNNWLAATKRSGTRSGTRPGVVSHLGMHCTEEELDAFRRKFAARGIPVAQEVFTVSHTNPYLLSQGRKYQYAIFDTHDILGVDLKFIVRREAAKRGSAS